jgi:hypothetical protein
MRHVCYRIRSPEFKLSPASSPPISNPYLDPQPSIFIVFLSPFLLSRLSISHLFPSSLAFVALSQTNTRVGLIGTVVFGICISWIFWGYLGVFWQQKGPRFISLVHSAPTVRRALPDETTGLRSQRAELTHRAWGYRTGISIGGGENSAQTKNSP